MGPQRVVGGGVCPGLGWVMTLLGAFEEDFSVLCEGVIWEVRSVLEDEVCSFFFSCGKIGIWGGILISKEGDEGHGWGDGDLEWRGGRGGKSVSFQFGPEKGLVGGV